MHARVVFTRDVGTTDCAVALTTYMIADRERRLRTRLEVRSLLQQYSGAFMAVKTRSVDQFDGQQNGQENINKHYNTAVVRG